MAEKHNQYIPNGQITPKKRSPTWQTLPLYKKIQIYRNDLGALHAQYTDKLQVKQIVKHVCGSMIKTAPIVRILENSSDLKITDINPNHFLKAAHGCGWLLDLAETNALKKGTESLRKWNSIYSNEERQYTFLKPRFFIEEKIHCAHYDKKTKALDIKVNCFTENPFFCLFKHLIKNAIIT